MSPSSLPNEKTGNIAKQLDSIANEYNATPVLASLTPPNDCPRLHYELASLMSTDAIVIDDVRNLQTLTACLANCIAYVGSSPQAYFVASSFDVPAICVNSNESNVLRSVENVFISPNWTEAKTTLQNISALQASQIKKKALRALDTHWKHVNQLLQNTANVETPPTSLNTFHADRLEISATLAQIADSKLTLAQQSSAWKLAAKLTEIVDSTPRLLRDSLKAFLPKKIKKNNTNPFQPTALLVNQTHYSPQRPIGKTVVYTANMSNYDTLYSPEIIDPDIDYVCFTNTPIDDHGIWELRPPPAIFDDNVQMSRYPKLHPHTLFPDYENVIWMDANIRIPCDVRSYINTVINNDADIGIIIHPHRDCLYDEALTCKRYKRTNPNAVNKQMRRYRENAFPSNAGLFESNFFITRIQNTNIAPFFDTWWSEFSENAKRDQLSVTYARFKSKISITHLLPPGYHCENHPDFEIYKHNKS